MKQDLDYICLIDDAKLNLSSIINFKMQEYKKNPTQKTKEEILELINDRKKLFLFDEKIILKYL